MNATRDSLQRLDERELEAVVEIMVLAASADGEFQPIERERLEACIASVTSERLKGDRLGALFADIEARIGAEGRESRLKAVKEALGAPEDRKLALELAVEVMAADGILRTTERELILETADALELDPAVAADVVKAVGP